MIRTALLSLLLVGGVACDAQAPSGNAPAPPPIVRVESDDPLPPLTGRVVDQAGILDPAAEAELGERLEALEKETTDQMVVVTVPSLGNERIEDLGLRLGNGWGIGRKGVDNGILLIVAPAERQARIEVGKGLTGLLTDQRAQGILDKQVIPTCRKGHCDRAIEDAVKAISKVLRSDGRRPRPGREAA